MSTPPSDPSNADVKCPGCGHTWNLHVGGTGPGCWAEGCSCGAAGQSLDLVTTDPDGTDNSTIFDIQYPPSDPNLWVRSPEDAA